MISVPPELYLIIFGYLDEPDDKRPLCRLAQTCKGIRDAVNPFIYQNNTFQYPSVSYQPSQIWKNGALQRPPPPMYRPFDHNELDPRFVNSITRFNCYAKADHLIRQPIPPQDQVLEFTKALAPHLKQLTGSFAVVNSLFSEGIENNLTRIHIFFNPIGPDGFFSHDRCLQTYPLMKEVTLEYFTWHRNAAQCLARMFPNLETLRILLLSTADYGRLTLPGQRSRPVIFENMKRLNIVCSATSHRPYNYSPPGRKEYFSGKLEQLHIEIDRADKFSMIIGDGLPYPNAIKILTYSAIIPETEIIYEANIHRRFLFQEFIPTLSNLQALQLGYVIEGVLFQEDEPFSFGVTIRDILEMCPNLKILAFHHFPLQWLDRPRPNSASSLKSHPLRLFRAVVVENLTADDMDTLTDCCTELQELTIQTRYDKSTVTLASFDRLLAKFGPTSLQRLSFDFPTDDSNMGNVMSHISLLKSIAQHCSNRLQFLSLRLDLAYGSDKDAPALLETLLDTLRALSRLIYLGIPENSFSSKHVYTPTFFADLVTTVADRLEEFNAIDVFSQHFDLVCATLLNLCQKLRYIDACASPSLRENPSYNKYKHLLKFVEQYPVDYAVSDLFNTRFTMMQITTPCPYMSLCGSNSWKETFRFGVLGYREVKKLVDQISNSQISL